MRPEPPMCPAGRSTRLGASDVPATDPASPPPPTLRRPRPRKEMWLGRSTSLGTGVVRARGAGPGRRRGGAHSGPARRPAGDVGGHNCPTPPPAPQNRDAGWPSLGFGGGGRRGGVLVAGVAPSCLPGVAGRAGWGRVSRGEVGVLSGRARG